MCKAKSEFKAIETQHDIYKAMMDILFHSKLFLKNEQQSEFKNTTEIACNNNKGGNKKPLRNARS